MCASDGGAHGVQMVHALQRAGCRSKAGSKRQFVRITRRGVGAAGSLLVVQDSSALLTQAADGDGKM